MNEHEKKFKEDGVILFKNAWPTEAIERVKKEDAKEGNTE